jgi:pilus assembly protein CpaF
MNLEVFLHDSVIDRINTDQFKTLSPEEKRSRVRDLISRIVSEEKMILPRHLLEKISSQICDEIVGLGPIDFLLRDETVTEIMANGPFEVYIERDGKLFRTEIQFADEERLLRTIERIVAPLGLRIDESSPKVDGRLPDGSRINAVIAPISLRGPVLTIRKFSARPISIEELVARGSLSSEMAALLGALILFRKNIVISGGAGSGKTTLLNSLSAFIPPDERLITIEDSAELNLNQPHVISLESRPPNIEGKGEITIRDLVRNALRMRPDRIIVGEVRGGEALDMLQAMNTGHDGSLTTAHANSPADLISRLETMALMSDIDLPVRVIREQIVSALDFIVHLARFSDGTRKITNITEVQRSRKAAIRLQDIFYWRFEGLSQEKRVLGSFRATGFLPTCLEQLHLAGIELPEEVFRND